MSDTTRLFNMISEHWKTHRPRMVAELESTGQLTQALSQAEMRAANLLHEFLSMRKMQYAQAWELAMQECLLPEETSSPISNLSQNRPATSG
jgi:hypothetical protein